MIYQQAAAKELLENSDFLTAWETVWRDTGASVFQSRNFVLNWYSNFPDFPVILVTDWDGKSMSGLLTLTEQNGELLSAGLDLAEYQTWMLAPEKEQAFLEKLLTNWLQIFPDKLLHLKYLPASKSFLSIAQHVKWSKNLFFEAYEQPLMDVNQVDFLETELKKKNKKEKLNRLKRLGTLDFLEIHDQAQFESLLDEMILLNDFRKGAFYGKTYFMDEPERKEFLLRLFENNCLHVTVLMSNDQMISFNVGMKDAHTVYLQGLNGHHPKFSKYSPGILLFLMLGVHLNKTGYHCFDLTPGGADGYKKSLSTSIGTAYDCYMGSEQLIAKLKFKDKIKEFLKPRLQGKKIFGEEYDNLSNFRFKMKLKLKTLKSKLPISRAKEYTCFLNEETQVIPLEDFKWNVLKSKTSCTIHSNEYRDLFLYKEISSNRSIYSVLSDCMLRIENGQELYTIVEKNCLKGIAWYIPVDPKRKGGLLQDAIAYSYLQDPTVHQLDELVKKINQDFSDTVNGESMQVQIAAKNSLFGGN
ncbi:GNAT family N-acetyltransferase [Mongoliitalea daihaiensis]|uniref:GNAT family N-acetyltransferase n=1 Tax=Mongoliitalea daihaiensis TaxID=2782006 RepID=UPI001F1B4574|nr:GNAT family N-acetyltransferase [Mongoliitalea daihaiensis]